MCQKIIQRIRDDHTSGASELSRLAAQAFILLCSAKESDSKHEFLQAVLRLGKDLVLAQPAMAPIFNLVNLIFSSLEVEKESLSENQGRELVKLRSEDFIEESLRSLEKIGAYGSILIQDGFTVLTHSSSGSILSVFRKAKKEGRSFRVFATESRPMLEGRILARFLGEEGIDTTLIIDAAVGIIIGQVDLILTGADSVFETSLVNKVGTAYLALLSREKGIPFYVACERSKFMFKACCMRNKGDGDPDEVLTEKPSNVKIMNPYYEEIPLSFCQGIITDKGILLPSDVNGLIKQAGVSKKLSEELELPTK